jgi:hypothetical protein
MVHPYRDQAPIADEPRATDREHIVLHALFVAIGLVPVVPILSGGAHFGVEATLGLVLVLVGVRGLVAMPRTR